MPKRTRNKNMVIRLMEIYKRKVNLFQMQRKKKYRGRERAREFNNWLKAAKIWVSQ